MKILVCMLLASAFLISGVGQSRQKYGETRHPIVLVHGMFGWDQALGIFDYFYKIPRDLNRIGAKVYVARVSGLDSAEVRGEQLLAQVEEIIAIGGHQKVHLIGHSQGSPTSRYVAAVRPDLVASVVSANGANGGSRVADILNGRAEDQTIDAKALAALSNAINDLVNLVSKNPAPIPADFEASIHSLTTESADKFNAKYPYGINPNSCDRNTPSLAENGVHYFSFGGTSPFTRALDPSDYILTLTHSISFRGGSDGMIGRCANHLGQVIRDDYAMNHIDAMNHLFGVTGTNPRAVYKQVAHRLVKLNL